MTPRIRRLARLHALRSQLADAAGLQRKQIAQQIQETETSNRRIQEEIAAAYQRNDAPWNHRRALLTTATVQQQYLAQEQERLHLGHADARSAEHEAVRSREQMLKMVERAKSTVADEQARRTQAALDDAYLIALTRRRMTTRF